MRQLSELVDGLDRRGHSVSVVALYPKDNDWRHLWGAGSVNIRTLLSGKRYADIPGPITLIKAVSRLRGILRRERPEIIYAVSGNAARFISWLAVGTLRNAKLVWGFRGAGNQLKLLNNDITYRIPIYTQRWISPFIPLAIYNSDAGLTFREGAGYNVKKQLVIYNGFDTGKFAPDAEARNRMRREWRVSGKEKLIGVAGRVTPAKGFHIFLKAASFILKERTDVRFICVGDGDGSYKGDIKAQSGKLGLSDRIVWRGTENDMTSIYNGIDILCSSSYAEGFPNVIGEAMACGVPCVVTDVGDSAKIVGDTGIAVPLGEPEALAKGLLAMMERLPRIDPILIRARIVENFTFPRMVDETEKALRELLDGGQPECP